MRRLEIGALAAILIVAAGIFTASALRGGRAAFAAGPSDYYGYLAAGLKSGHVYVAIEPNPGLLALPNPYDPVANAPFRVHDMSLWNGKYYLYFGITPALVLLLPCYAAFGSYPTEPLMVAVFGIAGVCLAAAILTSIRRRYFPGIPTWILPLAVACLAFANPALGLTQGAEFYQVAISCAYALNMAMLGALYRAVHSRRTMEWWLAAAGALFGLTVGARPNYLPCIVVLAMGWHLCARIRTETKPGSSVPWNAVTIRLALAAAIPIAACGAGLMLYNWLRFGSVTEFGTQYELTGESRAGLATFSVAHLGPFVSAYLLKAGSWSPYFPFFSQVGGTFGLLRYLPWIWLSPWALGSLRSRHQPESGWHAFSWMVGASAAINLLLLCIYAGVNGRYASDFGPALVLLGSIGALGLAQKAQVWVRAGIAGAGFFSIAVSMAAVAQGIPQEGAFLAVERVVNTPLSLWQRVAGTPLGGLRLELELPTAKEGATEPLFQTGRSPDQRDWLQIQYLKGGRARLSLFHAGIGPIDGDDFEIPADRRLAVEASCGSLLPPIGHPLYSGMSKDDYAALNRDLTISVNGREVLRALLQCYDSSPQDLLIGRLGWASGSMASAFSGKILGTSRAPFTFDKVRRPVLHSRTPIELTLYLPANRTGGSEPILVTGKGQRSDLLYSIYERGNRVRFGFDHFSNGGPVTRPIDFDPSVPHELTVWVGSLADAATPQPLPGAVPLDRRLAVQFDGKMVLNSERTFFPASPEDTVLGTNAYDASTALKNFSGRITNIRAAEFSAVPPLRLDGERGPVDLTVVFPTNVMGVTDPLVVTGAAGAGDFLYVRYVDGLHVVFGFDHWGFKGLTSNPVTIDYAQPHRIELSMGSLYASDAPEALSQDVRILLDGKIVLEGRSPTYPCPAATIHLLSNPIGGSTTGPVFNGHVVSVDRPAK